jgi:hypothetical protein
MKSPRFLIPVIAFLIATPVFLLAALASAGAGHGNYLLAKVLFPFTMLSTLLFGSISYLFIGLAIAQYPLYGLLVGTAHERQKGVPYTVALFVVHAAAVIVCLLLVRENFS